MADPREKNYTEQINVPCTPTDKDMAKQLADDAGLPMSHIMRTAVRTLHQMTFANQPHCATGRPCICPQLHSVRIAGQMTDAERVQAAKTQLDTAPPAG